MAAYHIAIYGYAFCQQGSAGLDGYAPPQGSRQQSPEEYEQAVAPVYHHYMSATA